ncbi:uncharacterized protein LOC123716262 isoform X3 [Pieris brassicae]|uniref:uncharacterized protein LOC123716262 isoform X3 n=1 Tax=Pieris brassicae TaxID=7116 RepID=UPI001E65FB59|nr:uncharacterized protein LOC123716262 isoform X3 [Pieris brassicae]
MAAIEKCHRTMQQILTAILIIALSTVVYECSANATDDASVDQMAMEARAVPVVANLTAVNPKHRPRLNGTSNYNQTLKLEHRPPSKPPIYLTPDKKFYISVPQHYYKSPPPRHVYSKEPLKVTNGIYKFPGINYVKPGQQVPHYYNKPQQLIYVPTTPKPPTPTPKPQTVHQSSVKPKLQSLTYAASTGNPISVTKAPVKANIPVQTVNTIRTDYVKPPSRHHQYIHVFELSPPTTIEPTTTTRLLRTKRIWPKRILDKMNNKTVNASSSIESANYNNSDINVGEGSSRRFFVYGDKSDTTTANSEAATKRPYRRVSREHKSRNNTHENGSIKPNEWVPIQPSHFAKLRSRRHRNKRSVESYFDSSPYVTKNYPMSFFKDYQTDDYFKDSQLNDFYNNFKDNTYNSYLNNHQSSAANANNPLYLHTYGLIPMSESLQSSKPTSPNVMIFGKKKRRQPSLPPAPQVDLSELHGEASGQSKAAVQYII